MVDIKQLVHNAVDRVSALAAKKSITLNTTIKEGASIPGNEISLTEAVVAILENAVKYSADNSQIELRMSDQAKQVVIEIQDHGIGMKPDELDHIFERFYRADTARSKTKTSGYGIGLAIAKNIVDLHGGNITVRSKPGKGSTFVISLPKVISE
jgi:signal transduction histidine kinase